MYKKNVTFRSIGIWRNKQKLYNMDSYTGKMASLWWSGTQTRILSLQRVSDA